MSKLNMTPAALKAAADGDLENFLVAATPGGIEAQEAAGQRNLVSNFDRLPTRFLACGIDEDMPREQLGALGFTIGHQIDDIWTAVTPPNGWTLTPTEHSMWSEVHDDKGRLRMNVFYKAAFYDRNAHASVVSRYAYAPIYDGDYEAGTIHEMVFDNATGEPVFDAGTTRQKYGERDQSLSDKCFAFLDANYPEHRDPFAYSWE